MISTRLMFILVLSILVNPGKFEETYPPKNTSSLHSAKKRRLAICGCGFVANSASERANHICTVSVSL